MPAKDRPSQRDSARTDRPRPSSRRPRDIRDRDAGRGADQGNRDEQPDREGRSSTGGGRDRRAPSRSPEPRRDGHHRDTRGRDERRGPGGSRDGRSPGGRSQDERRGPGGDRSSRSPTRSPRAPRDAQPRDQRGQDDRRWDDRRNAGEGRGAAGSRDAGDERRDDRARDPRGRDDRPSSRVSGSERDARLNTAERRREGRGSTAGGGRSAAGPRSGGGRDDRDAGNVPRRDDRPSAARSSSRRQGPGRDAPYGDRREARLTGEDRRSDVRAGSAGTRNAGGPYDTRDSRDREAHGRAQRPARPAQRGAPSRPSDVRPAMLKPASRADLEKPEGMRLQRMMALAGVAARRTCETYILQGRVRVNDRVVTELGTRVHPGVDLVEFDGRTLNINAPRHYYLLYKPVGYLSSVSDPHGARVVTDLVPTQDRLYPVGRLDLNSEGLLLLTDDGDLTYRLTHPRYEHEKEYMVLVPAALDDDQIAQLQRGVRIQEVGWPARAAGAEQMPEDWHWRGEAVPEGHRWVRIVLKEGRKRQIRLMLEALGSEAVRLIRVRMGALTLDELKPGRGRWLRPVEVRLLRRSAELPDIELS